MEAFLKRKKPETGSNNTIQASVSDAKKFKQEVCPHGVKCYRKNPHHFKEFDHPHLMKLLEMSELNIPKDYPQDKSVYEGQLEVLRPLVNKPVVTMPSTSKSDFTETKPGTMLDKLKRAHPYNYFFTTIPKEPETLKQGNSVSFTDLLCPSLGKLHSSLQINFMIDIMWLMEQYKARDLHKQPMTILYGDDWPDMKEFIQKFLPNVTHHLVKMKDPFGCHHSKIGIYLYEDNSLRIVVSTANLYYEDWNHYNQGLWISPRCPRLASSTDSGESPTLFKSSLLTYLKHYNLPILNPWLEKIKNVDFSDVKVVLVTSVPGRHFPQAPGSHVHHVGHLLRQHCQIPKGEGPLSWGVIAQASSIGSMGKDAGDWLRGVLLRSLAGHKGAELTANSSATLSMIFPSVDNVMGGFWGPESGGCLPYSKATNEKQRWLQSYLHQWRADRLHRTKAMPHIKTYCRVSPCLTKLAWYLLTSANISKSAWGGNIQKNMSVYVRSYECGVMFLPKFFDQECFEIQQTMNNKNREIFPMMYDLPLIEYKSSDYPWCN